MRVDVRDGILGGFSRLASLLVVGVFAWIALDLLKEGMGAVNLSFLTNPVEDSGRGGGIGPVLLSTLLILLVCLLTAMPLGVLTALWLTEFAPQESRIVKLIQASIDLLASVPSIVFGLFGMVFFCQVLGLGFSILAGGLTLTCMVLPIVIHTTVSGLRAAPAHLRITASALGMSKVRTIVSLLIPVSWPGVLVGFTLGTGRALAETAALLFTSGYATRWPESLSDSGRSISVHIYDMAMNIPGGGENAAGSALVLLVFLLLINFLASSLSDAWRSRYFRTDP